MTRQNPGAPAAFAAFSGHGPPRRQGVRGNCSVASGGRTSRRDFPSKAPLSSRTLAKAVLRCLRRRRAWARSPRQTRDAAPASSAGGIAAVVAESGARFGATRSSGGMPRRRTPSAYARPATATISTAATSASASSPHGVQSLDCCLGSSSHQTRTFRSGVRPRRHSSGFVIAALTT